LNNINYKMFGVIILIVLFTFIGCSSMKPIPYNFTEDEINSSSISFTRGNPRASFVDYNNNVLPSPERRTYWAPIFFPSGVPLEITVHAYYFQQSVPVANAGLFGVIVSAATATIDISRFVDVNVLFRCPPLEAGKNYSITFRKEPGIPGKNILILTDTAERKIIYQQEFEMR